MKRIKGWLGVFLIFLFGVVVGVVIASGSINQKIRSLVEGGPDKVVDAVAARLRNELHLNSQQQEMLQQIVVETRIKLSAIRQQTQPQVAAALMEAEHRVRGILNHDQIPKFDQIVKKGRDRWKAEAAFATSASQTPAPSTPAATPSATPTPPAPEATETPAPPGTPAPPAQE